MAKRLVSLTLTLVLALWIACSSQTTAPMGCVQGSIDGGTVGLSCAIAWSCNSDNQHYQLSCTPAGGDNYSCVCSTDTSSIAKTIVVNAFICDATGSIPAFSACGYDIQTQM
jgi:hypothetical protein